MHLECQGLGRHGYLHVESCLTNLSEFVDDTSKKIKGSTIETVIVDFSNTFDKVSHGRLFHMVGGLVTNFADDTKIGGVVLNEENYLTLQ